ncbi:hypothetical protein TNCV_3695841 [Trichonephila clavipes]|nr:hypothetical protein TNCV_3695841 [Trichonephila clavipes]
MGRRVRESGRKNRVCRGVGTWENRPKCLFFHFLSESRGKNGSRFPNANVSAQRGDFDSEIESPMRFVDFLEPKYVRKVRIRPPERRFFRKKFKKVPLSSSGVTPPERAPDSAPDGGSLLKIDR